MKVKNSILIDNDLLIKSVNFEKIDRAPVWMMRQAGRYLPEYRAVREKLSFLELCKNPEMAAEVSIQPLEILGVDAIIMFSDILVLLEPMGASLSFDTGSPKFSEPIRSKEQIDRLIVPDLEGTCHFVYETIHEIKKRITREVLNENQERILVQKVPVLGFAGAPWTLASYLIEGGTSKNFDHIKSLMYHDPKSMHLLLSKLSETVLEYLLLKVKHGVDMLQLFDTWASVLSQDDYKEYALPYQQYIIRGIKSKYPDMKIVLYVNGVANVIDYMIDSSADVLSVDWTVNIAEIRNYLSSASHPIAMQGNFDPCYLLGPEDFVRRKTVEMLDRVKSTNGSLSGYIANLGHGILPSVRVANAAAFIDTVKSYS